MPYGRRPIEGGRRAVPTTVEAPPRPKTPIRHEAIVAAKWWADRLREKSGSFFHLTEERIANFERELASSVSWEMQCYASICDVILTVNLNPYHLLASAANAVRLKLESGMLPDPTVMCIGEGRVQVRTPSDTDLVDVPLS